MSKTTTLHVHYPFLYISLLSPHNYKASGYDGLSVRVLKKNCTGVANPLWKYLIFQYGQTVFLTTGKQLKSHHCIKEEHEMISTLIAPYRFYLSFRKFSKRTWPALYLFSYAIITYYRSCNQPLGQDSQLKQP